MNAEFNVWLLIVGLVVGAGLAWLVMMDGRRREIDIDEVELPREAAWIAALLAEDGYDVSPEAAEQALLLHRAYLGAPPPDPVDVDEQSPLESDGGTAALDGGTAPSSDSGSVDAPQETTVDERIDP